MARLDIPEDRLQIYVDRQPLVMLGGIFTLVIAEALAEGNLGKIKLYLALFCSLSPEEIKTIEFYGIKPFKAINANNIQRYPDQLWIESMLDPNSEKISTDCPCMVSFYRGELYVRWTLPTLESVFNCSSVYKLVYTLMVTLEELYHVRQMISPNARAIITLSLLLEFDKVKEISQMEAADKELLTRILEADITFFMQRYLGNYGDVTQWFLDRKSAQDEHKPMTYAEFITGIVVLVNKYGYPEELADTIVDDITELACGDEALISELLSLLEVKKLIGR